MFQTPPPEDHREIAEKVRSGEYFNEALDMYDLTVHDPMAERYIFIGLTLLSLLSAFIAYNALNGLYPLRTPVPFVVTTNDIVDNYIHIEPLAHAKGETPADAVLNFLVRNYVILRERYDITSFERDKNGVDLQSSDDVAKIYDAQVERGNPQGPVMLYQRHSRRGITVLSSRQLADGSMEVTYEATVVSTDGSRQSSHWEADVAFNFGGVGMDDKTGESKPLKFTVTKYTTKRLQD